VEALGGDSTVLVQSRPRVNWAHQPTYGYLDEGEFCIGVPCHIERTSTSAPYIRDDFVCFSHADAALIASAPDMAARIAELTAARDGLRAALEGLYDLCLHANAGAWENGVTDPTGTLDEGMVHASGIMDVAFAALSATPGKEN
jgi:hypothetical protein